jgi:hypothetical protein
MRTHWKIIRVAVVLVLMFAAGCASSKTTATATNDKTMKAQKAKALAQAMETKMHSKSTKWKVERRAADENEGVLDWHLVSGAEGVLMYVAIKDNASSALGAWKGFCENSAGMEPQRVPGLGENACLMKAEGGCRLSIQVGDTVISISAASEARAREFAKDVLDSVPRR